MNDFNRSLETDTRNLSKIAKKNSDKRPLHRQREVDELLEFIGAGQSVLLVGEPGVGKTSILWGLAEALAAQKRELREMTTINVLAGTRYLGDWQTKLQNLIKKAKKRKAVLYVTDIWNLSSVGASSSDKSNLLDFLLPHMENGSLVLAGELLPAQLQELNKQPGMAKLFRTLRVEPLSPQQIDDILNEQAQRLLMDLTTDCLSQINWLSKSFGPHQSGPGMQLQLLDQIRSYADEKAGVGETESISPDFIDKVFAIHSGLPRFVVSRHLTRSTREIRDWFRQRIVGQEQAIESVVETIALFKSGLRDPDRPIGTFLFVGPTGVGKTELAKVLAEYLFGHENRLLRFDMSEYKDYHSFQLLLGDPGKPDLPARLIDPVRVQPFQVVLLDEMEKAHQNVWDLLLQLLDEGRLTPPKGATVNFRNCILICTSNAGASELGREGIGFQGEKTSTISLQTLEQSFRPEMLNRFQHIINFHPLSREHVREIARKDIKRILSRDGIVSRNLALDIGEELIDVVVDAGHNEHYGARALKREIQSRVALPIATFLMENSVENGSLLKLEYKNQQTRVKSLSTDASRAGAKLKKEEQKSEKKRLTLGELSFQIEQYRQRILELGSALGMGKIAHRLSEIDQLKRDQNFWNDRHTAHERLIEAERLQSILNRQDGLGHRLDQIETALKNRPSDFELNRTQDALEYLDEKITRSYREMVTLGSEGDSAILVMLAPIGGQCMGRDLLFETYQSWSSHQQFELQVLHEPQAPEEPVFMEIQGSYAYGYLRAEAGVHRFRKGEERSATRVSIAANGLSGNIEKHSLSFGRQAALKQMGDYGGKIRSLVEIQSPVTLCLKNGNSINQNRESAGDLVSSWLMASSPDDVIRRYDLEPFYVKDYLCQLSGGKRDILSQQGFQRLLADRVDLTAGVPD